VGLAFALLGVTLAVGMPCAAAGTGISWVQSAAAAVTAENPDKFSKTLVFQLVPTAAGLYGFVVGFLVMLNTVMAGSSAALLSPVAGLVLFASCLPVAFTVGAIPFFQAQVCTAGVVLVGQNDEMLGRALTMSVISELFNLFGFIVSVISVMMLTSGDVLASL
jgi:V/A-type H+-transporting ATPase subunit K